MVTYDKNGVAIQKGHLVKRFGVVQYADGPKKKFSKKTWIISEVNDEGIFYTEPNGEKTLLGKKDDIEYVIIGDTTHGVNDEYAAIEDAVVRVAAGSVGRKFRALKDVESQDWKHGDIVMIYGKVHKDMLENGVIELYEGDSEHKHVIVVVDPVAVGLVGNQ